MLYIMMHSQYCLTNRDSASSLNCNSFPRNADFHSYDTRNRNCVHMTTCRLILQSHNIYLALHYGTVCLYNSQTIHSFQP